MYLTSPLTQWKAGLRDLCCLIVHFRSLSHELKLHLQLIPQDLIYSICFTVNSVLAGPGCRWIGLGQDWISAGFLPCPSRVTAARCHCQQSPSVHLRTNCLVCLSRHFGGCVHCFHTLYRLPSMIVVCFQHILLGSRVGQCVRSASNCYLPCWLHSCHTSTYTGFMHASCESLVKNHSSRANIYHSLAPDVVCSKVLYVSCSVCLR